MSQGLELLEAVDLHLNSTTGPNSRTKVYYTDKRVSSPRCIPPDPGFIKAEVFHFADVLRKVVLIMLHFLCSA